MAVNIGPKIGIEGEAEYRRQLQNIIQSQKTLNSEMKSMESAWDKDTSAKQKAAQQSEALNTAITNQKRKIEELEYGLSQASQKFGENDTRTLKWKQALADARAELNRLDTELKNVPNSLQIMGQKMQDAGQKIQSIGRGMTNVGGKLSRTVTAPIVGIGTAAVKTTADFDESMSKVMALSGATGDEFVMLRDKARDLGKRTKYSAGEAADAMSYMALAGWDSAQMMEGLDGVLDLAAASGMDLASASDLVTDYLSAFGLEAKDAGRMADQLAYAQAHSNTTTTQLGEAFGNSAAQMNTAGQSMETTTAILEAFANQGLKGSEAGTALSAMMRDITQKMKNGKIQIGDTSIAVKDQNGNFRSLVDILGDVEAATDGMGSAEKSAALMQTFTARSVKGVSMALTEGIPAIRKYEQELYNSQGAAKNMADIMQDNLKGQLTILKSQMQELGISIGDILVPSIRKAVDWVQKQVDKFNALDDSTKEQIVKYAGLAAAIGPVLLIGGKLVTSIGNIVSMGGKAISWIGSMIPSFAGLAAAVGPVLGAFGLAVGAGAALGFVLKDLSEKFGFTSAINEFNQYVLATAEAARDARRDLDQSTESIKSTAENAEAVMKEVETSAELTDRYASELYELAGKTELTTEEQRRLEAIVSRLNEIYPGFSDAVMDSNGNLKMGVAELKEYIKQLKESARVKALQSIIEEYTAKIVEATKEQIEAEEALTEVEEAAASAAEERNAVLQAEKAEADRVTEAQRRLQEMQKSGEATAADLAQAQADVEMALAAQRDGYLEVNGEAVKYDQTMGDLTDSQNAASSEVDAMNESLDESRQAVADAEEKVDKYQAELDELMETSGDLGDAEEELAGQTDELGDVYEETAEEIENASEKIREAYEKTRDDAKTSVMDQVDLFSTLEKKEETSVAAMRDGLRSHIQAYREWNQNAKKLMESSRYSTDENFRAIVNTIIQTGIDAAPELAALVKAFDEKDQELELLVQNYGSMNYLAEGYAKSIADAKTAAEYGLQALKEAMVEGAEGIHIDMAKAIKSPTVVVNALKDHLTEVGRKGLGFAKKTGQTIGEGVGAGESESKGAVQQGAEELYDTAEAGVKAIEEQENDAQEAGQALADGISAGVRAGRAGINTAFTTIRTATSQGITQIQNLKSSAKTAGMQIVTNLNDGIVNSINYVTTALNSVETSINTGIESIENKKSDAKSAGTAIGTELANGLTSQSSSVYAAGNSLGQQLSSGLSSTSGTAALAARSVANAARAEIQAADNADLYAWGNHMGQNFANGLASAIGAASLAAARIAQAVKDQLGHSTPKEGPLKDDDIWGLHMGHNFAQGMREAIPDIKSAATEMANAALIPTSTVLNIDAISGRNVAAEPVTAVDMTAAFIEAAEQIDWRVVIGNREFGRVLREQGAFA